MPRAAIALRSLVRHGIVAATGLALVSCTPVINTRGHVPEPDAVEKLAVGKTTRTDVQKALGSPSTVGTFQNNVWYYIGEKTETVAFYSPEVLERRILAVVFDDRDVVSDVVSYTEADGKHVEIVSRVTPTAGQELTILQQLFGNLGRFNAPPARTPGPGDRRRP
ncbi:MAG: outer membrane protein assembly factor BamE [Alphaproteobacteria bacterium]|nr:outer membrane protein assembly factor BamE [Alphaproteobacteria bacterium]